MCDCKVPYCDNPRLPDSKFCGDHQVCIVDGCSNLRCGRSRSWYFCEGCSKKLKEIEKYRYKINEKVRDGICRHCITPVAPGKTLCEKHLKYHANKYIEKINNIPGYIEKERERKRVGTMVIHERRNKNGNCAKCSDASPNPIYRGGLCREHYADKLARQSGKKIVKGIYRLIEQETGIILIKEYDDGRIEWRCRAAGKFYPDDQIAMDHRIAIANGGHITSARNLQSMERRNNGSGGKGTKDMHEYMRECHAKNGYTDDESKRLFEMDDAIEKFLDSIPIVWDDNNDNIKAYLKERGFYGNGI